MTGEKHPPVDSASTDVTERTDLPAAELTKKAVFLAPSGGDDAPPPPPPPDRTPRIGASLAAAFVVAGLGLIVKSRLWPVPHAPPPPAAVAAATELTSAIVDDAGVVPTGSMDDAGALAAADGGAKAPEGPRFVPAWRVAALKTEPNVEIVEGVLGKRSFAASLAQTNLSKAEIRRVTHAIEGIRRVEHPAPKDAFVLARDKAKGTVLAFEYVASPTDIWQAKGEEPFVAKKLELFVERKRITSALTMTADVAKAVTATGLREEIREAIDDALDGHLDLASMKPGMRMRMVVTEESVEGAFSRYRVEAMEVASGGSPLRVYFYERDPATPGNPKRAPHPGYYDAKGQQAYKGAFRSPLPMARVTSRFNPRRMHPVLHTVMPHNGVDFGASTGTPVFASAPGTITTAGNGGPCGNMVEISHAGGLNTAYCHLSRFAAGLHPGQHVEARQLVGYVGQTGRATGPHLHFVAKRAGVFIDPLVLKMDGVRVLPGADREAFAARRTELDAALDAIPLPAATGEPVKEDDEDKAPAEE